MSKASRPAARGKVVVADGPARSILRGHPWVYREAVVRGLDGLAPGDIVDLTLHDGSYLGRGYADPTSPIAVRVLTAGDPPEVIDERLVEGRLRAALGLRAALLGDPATTAYRLCNGEGDGLPGLVIDRYEHCAVLRADGEAALAFARRSAQAVEAALRPTGVTSISLRPRDGDPMPWLGDPAPPSLVVREHGMKMRVDLLRGQKTGAFLDQRENRLRVRTLARGRRALNLFSYAGGFSVAAALGGASDVTSVDIASGGHAAAQQSFKENDLDPQQHRFVTADAFAFLTTAAARGERWGLVVSDPPSFAPSEKTRRRAVEAYRKLHAACLAVLEPGGLFCAASCSSHITPDEFLDTLALGRRDLRVAEIHGQPADHPFTPAWVEGRYLKFFVLRAPG